MPVQFNRHFDIRDITASRSLINACDLNEKIKKKYGISSEYEYRQFLMKNPGIVERFMFGEESLEE